MPVYVTRVCPNPVGWTSVGYVLYPEGSDEEPRFVPIHHWSHEVHAVLHATLLNHGVSREEALQRVNYECSRPEPDS